MSDAFGQLSAVLRNATDAERALRVWQLGSTAGATRWEVDFPDASSLRMAMMGLRTLNMAVYREIQGISHIRSMRVKADGTLEVELWSSEFARANEHVVKKEAVALKKVRLRQPSVVLPKWLDRSERNTVSALVLGAANFALYMPPLTAELVDEADGVRYTLHLGGFEDLDLDLPARLVDMFPTCVQDCCMEMVDDVITLRITLLRSAAQEERRKRKRSTPTVIYKRPRVEETRD